MKYTDHAIFEFHEELLHRIANYFRNILESCIHNLCDLQNSSFLAQNSDSRFTLPGWRILFYLRMKYAANYRACIIFRNRTANLHPVGTGHTSVM